MAVLTPCLWLSLLTSVYSRVNRNYPLGLIMLRFLKSYAWIQWGCPSTKRHDAVDKTLLRYFNEYDELTFLSDAALAQVINALISQRSTLCRDLFIISWCTQATQIKTHRFYFFLIFTVLISARLLTAFQSFVFQSKCNSGLYRLLEIDKEKQLTNADAGLKHKTNKYRVLSSCVQPKWLS